MRFLETIGRMILNGAIRRAMWRSPVSVIIAAALIGLLLMLAGNAHAQDFSTCHTQSNGTCPDRATAYDAAIQGLEVMRGAGNPLGWGASEFRGVDGPFEIQGKRFMRVTFRMTRVVSGRTYEQSSQRYWPVGADCPTGQTWDDATNQCEQPQCEGGAIRMANGQCSKTPEECQAYNTAGGFGVQTTKPFRQRCLANGCMLAMNGPGSCTTVGGSQVEMCNGEFTFSGAVCGAEVPPVFVPGPDTPEQASQNTPQECVAVGGGSHNYCVKSSGDHCMTSAQGRQLCWKPGETGTKTDGPIAQVRNAGTTPNVPPLDLPSGDTLQATGQSATASSGGTTTTTTNYKTVHGTNAGAKNQGETGDGSGEGKEQDPEKNTASGGEDCDRKPIVSDPAFEMIATQAWATRCAVELGNTAKITGDIADCSAPFSVEGDTANAAKLRGMRAQICGSATEAVGDISDCQSTFSVKGTGPDAHKLRAMRTQICGDEGVPWDAVGDGIAAVEGAAGEGDPKDAFTDGSEGGTGTPGGDGELDTGGFGYGRTCPTLPSIDVMGTTLDFNKYAGDMCRWIQLAGQIVLVLAALASLRIIAAGGA